MLHLFHAPAGEIEILCRGLAGLLDEPMKNHDPLADEGAVERPPGALGGLDTDLMKSISQAAGTGMPRFGPCSSIRNTSGSAPAAPAATHRTVGLKYSMVYGMCRQ